MKINLNHILCALFITFVSLPAFANWVLPDDVNNPSSPFSACSFSSTTQTVTCSQAVNLSQDTTISISASRLNLVLAQNLTLPAGININPDQRQFSIQAPAIQNNGPPINVNANMVSSGNIQLRGDALSRVRGSLQSDAQVTLNGVTVEGDIIAQQLTFNNGATLAGSADIAGTVVFNQGTQLGNLEAGSDVTLNNQSLIRGSVSTSGILQLNSGNIDGSVTASGAININNNSQITASVSSQQDVTINLGTIGGSLTARAVTINNSSSRVSGNVNAQQDVVINSGRVDGNLDTNGDVRLESGANVGNVNSRGEVINRGVVVGYINAPFIQQQGSVGETCSLNNNFGPCASQPGSQLANAWCPDIWQVGRTTTSFYPSQINLPEEALDVQLPRQLQPIDYLRRGVFGDVGENYVTNGATSRIFVDGDLTIQSGRRLNLGGPSEHFMLVVTGILTIEADVQINGYIYANRINFAPRRCSFGVIFCLNYEPNSTINGAVASATTIVNQGSGNAQHQPSIQYRAIPSTLNGGRFCLNSPRTELAVRFNDGPFIGSTEDSSVNRFNVRAVNAPGYSSAQPALPTNQNGFGTCGYTVLDPTRQQFFEVSNAAAVNFQGSFTMGAWVRPRSRATLMTIGSKDENYEVHITSDGRVNWWWQNRDGVVQEFTSNVGHSVPLNQWTYVAIRYTPREQTIFVNGNRTTRNFTGGLRQNTRPVQIGSDQNTANRYFDGFIDDFTLIRGALSDDEIDELSRQRVSCRQDLLVCEADTFDVSGNLTENWEVRAATVNGQTLLPRIVDNHLRLTEAQPNQSVVASLRRSFPARGNLIELEFTANMYGGSGADGIAVVFSDASTSPVQGGSGGSLGYAPRPDLNQPGFTGSWLAVALDAFGNFSQPSVAEGRIGGLSLPRTETANRVSMRGENYQFIPNSQSPQLVPSMRSQSSARGPAHRYRVRLDTRVEDQALMTVQRDITGTGSSFQTVVETFNLFNAAPEQRDSLPENLRISFSGSTGGSFQISEVGNVRVCAERSFAIAPELDHIRLHHPGEQISCQAAPLVLQACADAQCNSTAGNAINATITTTSNQAVWRGPGIATSNNQAVIPFQNGLASASLSLVEGGNLGLGLSNSIPGATSPDPLQCYVGGQRRPCDILFRTAGLMFFDADGQRPIQPQTSASPFQTRVRAIETNTISGACEARVEGPQNVDISLDCIDPGSCQAGQQLRFISPDDAIEVGSNSSVSLPLNFDATGGADLTLAYTDAGRIQLSGRLDIAETESQPATTLQGVAAPFVVKPADLIVQVPQLSAGFDHQVGQFIAGAPFELHVQAINAEGQPTPNFGRESTPTSVEVSPTELLFPQNGRFREGDFSSGDPQYQGAGRFVTTSASWAEAGSIRVQAEAHGQTYLDVPFSPATQTDIGRFYPDRIELETSEVVDTCTERDPFTYLGAPTARVSYELIALNANNEVLANYTVEPDSDYFVEVGLEFTHAQLQPNRIMSSVGAADSLHLADWEQGVLQFNPMSPSDEDILVGAERLAAPGMVEAGPFTGAQLRLFAVQNPDGISIDSEALTLNGALNLRFGRALLEDISGPEDDNLFVIIRTEYWDGEQFLRNQDDSCTLVSEADLLITTDPAALEPQAQSTPDALGLIQAGLNAQELFWRPAQPAPRAGEFEFALEVPSWLRYDWSGEGDFNELPSALATFGQYRGNDRIIFWLERGL